MKETIYKSVDEFLTSKSKLEGEIFKDIKIRKVKILSGRLHEQCKEMGLDSDDLVLVTTTYPEDKLPEYEIEKIEGSPTEFLKDRFLGRKSGCFVLPTDVPKIEKSKRDWKTF